MSEIYLLSTVVAPSFEDATLEIESVSKDDVPSLLKKVIRNFNGHPITNGVLKEVFPELPEPERAFWDGQGVGLAARPKGGVRGASQEGDTQVSLDDLEFALVQYRVKYPKLDQN